MGGLIQNKVSKQGILQKFPQRQTLTSKSDLRQETLGQPKSPGRLSSMLGTSDLSSTLKSCARSAGQFVLWPWGSSPRPLRWPRVLTSHTSSSSAVCHLADNSPCLSVMSTWHLVKMGHDSEKGQNTVKRPPCRAVCWAQTTALDNSISRECVEAALHLFMEEEGLSVDMQCVTFLCGSSTKMSKCFHFLGLNSSLGFVMQVSNCLADISRAQLSKLWVKIKLTMVCRWLMIIQRYQTWECSKQHTGRLKLFGNKCCGYILLFNHKPKVCW